MSITARLRELNVILPQVAPPVGSYVPAKLVGELVLTSGQLPLLDGELTAAGKVPEDVSLADAQEAAKTAAINALAAAASVFDGDIDRLAGIVRLAVFVNSSPGFTDQAKVANGASDFLVALFGDSGRHVRAAVGVAELPLNAAVELELVARVCP
ncbi:MAG: RidA family protein [Planctomycetes bacterium]|nr:RidA family protein [Planctomycetota bacterium]